MSRATPAARLWQGPPLGIKHHYAPLGAISVDSNGEIKPFDDKQNSCRKQFKSVTSLS